MFRKNGFYLPEKRPQPSEKSKPGSRISSARFREPFAVLGSHSPSKRQARIRSATSPSRKNACKFAADSPRRRCVASCATFVFTGVYIPKFSQKPTRANVAPRFVRKQAKPAGGAASGRRTPDLARVLMNVYTVVGGQGVHREGATRSDMGRIQQAILFWNAKAGFGGAVVYEPWKANALRAYEKEGVSRSD